MSFSIVYFTCALLIGIVIGFVVMLIIHCLDAYIGEYKHEKKRRTVKASDIKAIWKELNAINGRLNMMDEEEADHEEAKGDY